MAKPKSQRLSLHALSFEDALTNLIAVKPVTKGKKARQKLKAARRKPKNGSKRR